MGELATTVQRELRDRLAAARPGYDWRTEFQVGNTSVDVAGHDSERAVMVELEWRRADPVNNTVKLFRHLSTGPLEADDLTIFQVFTKYYTLEDGGISTRRENAEFVGRVAADALAGLTYRPLTLAVDPPKRGGELPGDWNERVADAVERISALS